jgi:hypothetical protein
LFFFAIGSHTLSIPVGLPSSPWSATSTVVGRPATYVGGMYVMQPAHGQFTRRPVGDAAEAVLAGPAVIVMTPLINATASAMRIVLCMR